MTPIDVSLPLFVGMPAFPDDPPFATEPVRRLARGDAYNLSRLSFGSHAGTHVDPPRHFLPDGASVDRLDLETLNGPCRVVGVDRAVRAIGPAELTGIPAGTTRVLLRTANSDRWAERLAYFPDYAALTVDGAKHLIASGVRLVGIDALSVESDAGGTFPVHRELLGRGIPILEGLLLSAAPPGPYDLHCLPLALRDGDGGPARAVLTPR